MNASLYAAFGFRAQRHWPKFYHYLVAQPGLRAMWNRYDGPLCTATIGAAAVIGRHAYCVKWADARVVGDA